MIYLPRSYQDYSTQKILKERFHALFLDMGLGKTVATLTGIHWLWQTCQIEKCLIVAPKMVVNNTWPNEIEKWDHLKDLPYVKITGTENKRTDALRKDAAVYLISCDNIPWLVAHLKGWWPFDMVVIDESTRFKNHASKRFKALELVKPFIERCVLLTGTPLGNGYIDLWAQIFLLDKGERLGKNISTYRKLYFTKNYSGWGYKPTSKMHEQIITNKISDICVSMRREDYIKLPPRIESKIGIKMDPELALRYREFERERIMEFIEKEIEITAVNAAVLTNKLLQFCNGAVYDEFRDYHEIHSLKLEALEQIVEDANGHPVLTFYEYQHDLDRIKKYLSRWKPQVLKTNQDVINWNSGKSLVTCAHVKSAGHGLNLQEGGHIIVFFGHNWSAEGRNQAIFRLDRPGQQHSVIVNDIILLGTMDEKVLASHTSKNKDERALMEAVKARIEYYKSELV